MEAVYADIWDYLPTHHLCITTNLGWNKAGDNVMGRGLAKQAAERYPDLPRIYGEICRSEPGVPRIHPVTFGRDTEGTSAHLIMFPTKELNPSAPWMSWRSKSSLLLIRKCIVLLKQFADTTELPIICPPFGCGNGGLDLGEMIDFIKLQFGDDPRFLLVLPKKKAETDSPLPY